MSKTRKNLKNTYNKIAARFNATRLKTWPKVEQFIKNQPNNLYSVTRAHKNPYFNMIELDKNEYSRLCKPSAAVSRQQAPAVYEMNASIYIYNRDFLQETSTIHSDKTMIYEMPENTAVDIDTELDFEFVEYLIKNGGFKFE